MGWRWRQARGRRLAGIPWGDGRHDLADDEELMLAELTPTRAMCAKCGAGDLEHFYTSKRGGRTLCAGCFEQREEQRLVWEVVARNS